MEKHRKKGSKLEDIFYLALGALSAYLIYQFLGIILHTQTPIVAVMTESMIPTIYPGDAVVVYGNGEIKVGDIIVFDAYKKGCRDAYGRIVTYPIIHRVIKINEDGTYETKGDHNLFQLPNGCESRISREYVYGKAILKIPLVGWPKKILVGVLNIFANIFIPSYPK